MSAPPDAPPRPEAPNENWTVAWSSSQRRWYYFRKPSGPSLWSEREVADFESKRGQKRKAPEVDAGQAQGLAPVFDPSAAAAQPAAAVTGLTPSFQPVASLHSFQAPFTAAPAAAAPAPAPAPAPAAPLPAASLHVASAHAASVAGHYNEIEEEGMSARAQALSFHLRKFNNWVKSTLIASVCSPGAAVLDFACGKGGDLAKYAAQSARVYVGADIAIDSVKAAVARYNKMAAGRRQGLFAARFACCDLSRVPLWEAGYPLARLRFDVVSIQFALHYMFESEERCHGFFRNVSNVLQPGGRFIATLPDANVLVRALRSQAVPAEDQPGAMTFGNDLYRTTFPPEGVQRQACMLAAPGGGDGGGMFGVPYEFSLDTRVRGCVEYLVPRSLLRRVAEQHGLQVEVMQNFQQYFHEQVERSDTARQLLYKLGVLDARGEVGVQEWETAHVYMVVVCRKTGAAAPLVGEEEVLPPGPVSGVVDLLHVPA